jgi:hypothetical protein
MLPQVGVRVRGDLAFVAGHRLSDTPGTAADQTAAVGAAAALRGGLRGVIQPWGILVRAQAAIGHEAMRWQAASGSLFSAYDGDPMHTPARVHHGLIDRLVQVEHIVEIDERPPALRAGGRAVRFDAVAWLSTACGPSWVTEGGLPAEGRAAIACDAVHGWLLIDPDQPAAHGGPIRSHDAAADWAAAPEHPAARGHVAALIDVGGTGFWLRATHIQATHLSRPEGLGHLVLELAGSPVLPVAGRWTVTRRGPDDPAPQALPAGQPMPVIQPCGDALWHVADATDLFGLRHTGPTAPRTEYGLVHDTGTQRLYFAHPRFEQIAVTSSGACGRMRLPPNPHVQLADWGSLLNSDSAFPPPDSTCSVRLSEAEMPTFGVDGWHFHLRRPWPDTRPVTLVDTGAAQVLLRRGEAAQPNAAPFDIAFSDAAWSTSLGPLGIDLVAQGQRLLSFAFEDQHADSGTAPQLLRPRLIPGRVLEPLSDWWPGLWRLSARGTADSGLPAALPLRLADGQLHIGCSTTLGEVDLGFGHLKHVPLTLGGTLASRPASVSFGLGLGSEAEPMALTVGPHVGAAVLRIGVHNDGAQLDVRVALALPMTLPGDAPDGGGAVLAVNLQADWGLPVRLGGVASGHAVVEVLDALAPVSMAVESPCRVRPNQPTAGHVRLEAELNFGLHLPLCSLLDMDVDTRWPLGVDIARGD